MKKIIVNIMTTTGITLIILALIAALHGAKFLFVNSVFQSFGANAVIHLGFILTNRYESKYPILESILDITYAAAVIIISGIIFNWYSSTPVWVVILMTVLIYIAGCLVNLFRIREDAKEINELLYKRKNITKLN